MIRLTEQQSHFLVDLLTEWVIRTSQLSLSDRPTLEQVRDIVAALNHQLHNTQHLNDLLDSVVALISEPRISALNVSQLSSLRKALFSPLELARFNALMANAQNCSGCGRALGEYEAVAIRRKVVFCYTCAPPTHIACEQCGEALEIDGFQRTIKRTLQRHDCSGPRPVNEENEQRSLPRASTPTGLEGSYQPSIRAPTSTSASFVAFAPPTQQQNLGRYLSVADQYLQPRVLAGGDWITERIDQDTPRAASNVTSSVEDLDDAGPGS